MRYVWARVLNLYCQGIRLEYFGEIGDQYGGHIDVVINRYGSKLCSDSFRLLHYRIQ